MGFSLVDVASEAGLGEALNVYGGVHINKYLLEEMGCGAAFFDYDNDGWLDIFLANGSRFDGLPPGSPPSNFLFHNNRDGTFTDVTRKAGLIRSGWGQGCCVGDYDNDGFDDLFVTYWGQNALYRNNGDGTFTDVTEKAGLIQKGPRPRWNTGCCFVDYDRDGRLDLFVADYVNFDLDLAPLPGSNKFCMYYGIPVACGPQGWSGGTNILYHNRGDGTFEDVSEAAGVTKPRGPVDPTTVSDNWLPVGSYGMSAVAADFDNDGWPDIYVSCDEAPSLLYHNNHDGTFTEIGVPAGCALSENGSTQGGMGIGVGDYDCDGWLDIVKPNFSDETISLYHNNGNGTFYDAVFQARLAASTKSVGWGAGLVDFDNDGWKDLFVSRGHVEALTKPGTEIRQHNAVFRNPGPSGRWRALVAEAGLTAAPPARHRGCAFGDFDGDGRIDAVVTALLEPAEIWMNRTEGAGHWLDIALEGTKSNRDGIGATVKVVTKAGAQYNHMTSSVGYASSSYGPVHFGLGEEKHAEVIEIRWPSGIVQTVRNVAADRVITVKEHAG